jgi:hypothetical protein
MIDELIAPQRVVANAEYPYRLQVERAREQMARMGVVDVKPIYGPPVHVANDATTPGRRSHLNRLIRTTLVDRLAG